MHKAYISLGSNQGNQIDNLRNAIRYLETDGKIKVLKVSSVYKTEPVGYEDQPWFYNAAAELKTEYSADQLLDVLLAVESQLGRVRNIRWGPRTIDLDLLLYDDIKMETEKLQLPHPRMLERDFVLIPLGEIAPNLEVRNWQLSELINNSKNNKKVVCIGTKLC